VAGNAQLKPWILEALASLGGEATVVEVAKYICDSHESELRAAGDLFYTWQYGMRWAAQELQKESKLAKNGKNRAWILTR